MEKDVNKKSKLWQISFFKGVAMLMIVLCHASQKFDIPTAFHVIPSFCQMGCQIFFALSAFSLCLSMDRKNDSVRAFYKRRFFSIAPGYWLAVITYVCFALITERTGEGNFLHINISLDNIGANIGLVHGLIPTEANNKVVKGGWYVGTLVLLYLLFPLLRNLYRMFEKRINDFAIILVVQITSFLLLSLIYFFYPSLSLANNKFLYFSFVNQLPSFCVGILLYNIFKKNKFNDVKYPLVKSVLIGLVALLLFFSHFHHSFVFEPLVFTSAFAYLFIYSLQLKVFKYNTLSRIILKYGENSYAIYLIHPLILYTGAYLLNTYYHTGLLIYMAWIPLSFVVVYYFGMLYNSIISKVQTLFSRE